MARKNNRKGARAKKPAKPVTDDPAGDRKVPGAIDFPVDEDQFEDAQSEVSEAQSASEDPSDADDEPKAETEADVPESRPAQSIKPVDPQPSEDTEQLEVPLRSPNRLPGEFPSDDGSNDLPETEDTETTVVQDDEPAEKFEFEDGQETNVWADGDDNNQELNQSTASFDYSDVGSIEEAEIVDVKTEEINKQRPAVGTIDYGSYFDGPKDRLVSRLVNNFESKIQEQEQTQPPSHKKSLSAGSAREGNDGQDEVPDRATADLNRTEEEDVEFQTYSSQPLTFATMGSAQVVDLTSPTEPPKSLDLPPTNSVTEHSVDLEDDPKSIPAPSTDKEAQGPTVGGYEEISEPVEATREVSEPVDDAPSEEPAPNYHKPSFQLNPIELEDPTPKDENVIFGVGVVGFHHARGPEVEYWVGPDEDKSALWPYLPFQSLPDGSHVHEENFCYFTLLYDEKKKIAVNPTPKRDEDGHIIEESDFRNVTTLFGISCNRQVKVEDLVNVTDDVTRSTVQKSVVVVARKPIFGPIKEKLTVVTRAYFIQGDFEDRRIVDNLYENLTQIFSSTIDESSLNIGLPLRELIVRLGRKVLVLLKALLLEKRVLFFASNTELLCASQFSLVSLIPSLINHLEDCGSPLLSTYETSLKKPTSLRTSDRSSLLAFMGLPLQLFAAGGIFSPYVPLQQLSELHADETKHFLVGSTNSLVLSSKPTRPDIIVNMDEDKVQILNKPLENALSLTSADKKWIDSIIGAVKDTWDPQDPSKTKGLVFHGSEDYIRVQFEDYIMHLLSSVKYDLFLTKMGSTPGMARDIAGNPLKEYGVPWVTEWKESNNFRIFNKFTDGELFDIVEPKHLGAPKKSHGMGNIPRQVSDTSSGLTAEEDSPPRDGIAKSVTRAFGSFWAKDTSPSPESKTDVKSTTSSGTATPVKNRAASIISEDQAETASISSSQTESRQSMVTVSSATSEAEANGYFSSLSRWRRGLFQKAGSTTSLEDKGDAEDDAREVPSKEAGDSKEENDSKEGDSVAPEEPTGSSQEQSIA